MASFVLFFTALLTQRVGMSTAVSLDRDLGSTRDHEYAPLYPKIGTRQLTLGLLNFASSVDFSPAFIDASGQVGPAMPQPVDAEEQWSQRLSLSLPSFLRLRDLFSFNDTSSFFRQRTRHGAFLPRRRHYRNRARRGRHNRYYAIAADYWGGPGGVLGPAFDGISSSGNNERRAESRGSGALAQVGSQLAAKSQSQSQSQSQSKIIGSLAGALGGLASGATGALLGYTIVIPDDYPFVCKCDPEGTGNCMPYGGMQDGLLDYPCNEALQQPPDAATRRIGALSPVVGMISVAAMVIAAWR
ncbi:unnamed protein product [Vitrella brassicaformis CCMP3155]|uniref:Uncharacterized protein n=2 Tax=Vitrella brassicaformis TaxID=1169539 RepID=A0A0G4FWA1_VITBC|nr:unnamed protein product [Vitrella brassicaformis CCMP3155]|eukprot:CEM19260.1 unnamed protein product [Vitrella brassicaformis CCMP3155]